MNGNSYSTGAITADCTVTATFAVNGWSKIAAGDLHTVVIKSDGTLWAWGYNSAGQLGDGTFTDKNTPTQIGTATNWTAVSAGNNYIVMPNHFHGILVITDDVGATRWVARNNEVHETTPR